MERKEHSASSSAARSSPLQAASKPTYRDCPGELSLKPVATLLGYAILMLGVCLLACVVPTRRALGVEPTIALRVD